MSLPRSSLALSTKPPNRFSEQYKIKDGPQNSPTQITLSPDDSEPEDDKLRPRFGAFHPLGYSPLPDSDRSSSPPEAVRSDGELVTYLEPDPDELSVVGDEGKVRFFGKSSLLAFAHKALDEKEYAYTPLHSTQPQRMEYWDLPDVFPVFIRAFPFITYLGFQCLTPILESPTVRFEFPERDLMLHLVDCYFDNFDLVLPLLHRPSFMRSIAEGFHELDQGFGATVLLVCAIGCRYTDDPRVVHELSSSTSCTAWSLYNQVNRIRKQPYLPHSLHEIQIYPVSSLFHFRTGVVTIVKLSASFLDSYSPLETPWLIIGTGLRIMQDSGVHRKSFSKKQSLEKELWKRAFWSVFFYRLKVKFYPEVVTQGLGRVGSCFQHSAWQGVRPAG